jgi:Kdo2-lipid IVA lauroyltransferase/acyltransferase
VKTARRHAIEARAASVCARLLAPLPRRLVLALGRRLGRLWGELDRRHVAIAAANLARAFPDWDEGRAWRTARGVYGHFGSILLDLLWLDARGRDRVMAVVDVEGQPHVERAMAQGRGVLLITGHIGNWELHGLAHGWTFGPIGMIARPLDNPALDERLCRLRGRGGNTVIYKRRALATVLRMLREGQAVAVLIDQNVQEKDGIFVRFFDRPAATTTVAAALALKTGCALLPTHAVLGADGRYRLVYEPALEWQPTGDRDADMAALTQRLTSVIEGWVRTDPTQWLWMHRRWKTQPGSETAGSHQLGDHVRQQ